MTLLRRLSLLQNLRQSMVWGALSLALAFSVQAQTQILGSKAAGISVKTPQVEATLLAEAPNGIEPGKTIWLGLQLVHQPHWHTYWRNPGDSGLPTELQWTLPDGMSAGNVLWPAPQIIPIGSMANFGYESSVLLVTPVQINRNFKPLSSDTNVQIKLHANWLVCKQECIPQEGDFNLSLPLKGATAMAHEAFEKAIQRQAKTLSGNHIARLSNDGKSIQFSMAQLPAELQNSDWTVFPQTAHVIRNSVAPVIEKKSSGGATTAEIQFRVSSERMDSPTRMTWLLAQGKAEAPTGLQWTVETPVQGKWQEFKDEPNPVAVTLNTNQAVSPNTLMAAPWATWGLALMGALLGGMLLNLMPCVFPVLAIKLLSMTQHADKPQEMKRSAWAFSAGVLISFLVLGALMLSLRAAGSQMGWGFQLQSPWVVGALAMLFAILGLNLSGMFEFGSFVPSSAASFQWANPVTNSLWSGVFAVVIASPCTAPFMGASLGLAIGLPAWQALPVFMAMGLGMALPFMAVSFSTAWVRFLPRPGAWMQTFRQFMAFPMYATVIWLVWVLGQQVGLDGATGFLACLLSLAMLLWALTLKGKFGKSMSVMTLVLFALSMWQWGPSWTQVEPAPALEKNLTAPNSGPSIKASQRLNWESWSADKVASARKEGRPVFVDFTAAWCVTCQFNKKTTFADAGLMADFAKKNVLLLRADWTRYDPAITAALNDLGRNGLPVYAWYAPGQAVSLLSELPTVKEIQNSLNQVKNSP